MPKRSVQPSPEHSVPQSRTHKAFGSARTVYFLYFALTPVLVTSGLGCVTSSPSHGNKGTLWPSCPPALCPHRACHPSVATGGPTTTPLVLGASCGAQIPPHEPKSPIVLLLEVTHSAGVDSGGSHVPMLQGQGCHQPPSPAQVPHAPAVPSSLVTDPSSPFGFTQLAGSHRPIINGMCQSQLCVHLLEQQFVHGQRVPSGGLAGAALCPPPRRMDPHWGAHLPKAGPSMELFSPQYGH